MPLVETAPRDGAATTAARGLASQGFLALLLVQMAFGFSLLRWPIVNRTESAAVPAE